MQWVPTQLKPITQPQWYIQVSPQVRAAYLAQAILWEPQNIRELTAESIRQGEPTSLQPDQEIFCTYLHKAHEELGGTSPKFECHGQNGEVYRINYGMRMHTTVAASRLLWALGFGAAISTPVEVICDGCPPDPWNKPRYSRENQVQRGCSSKTEGGKRNHDSEQGRGGLVLEKRFAIGLG